MITYRVVLLILLLMDSVRNLRDNMAFNDWWIADKVKETVETVKESAQIGAFFRIGESLDVL